VRVPEPQKLTLIPYFRLTTDRVQSLFELTNSKPTKLGSRPYIKPCLASSFRFARLNRPGPWALSYHLGTPARFKKRFLPHTGEILGCR
jgi:hypothetical protein